MHEPTCRDYRGDKAPFSSNLYPVHKLPERENHLIFSRPHCRFVSRFLVAAVGFLVPKLPESGSLQVLRKDTVAKVTRVWAFFTAVRRRQPPTSAAEPLVLCVG